MNTALTIAFSALAISSLAMTAIWICAIGLAGVLERTDRRANPFRETQERRRRECQTNDLPLFREIEEYQKLNPRRTNASYHK